MSGRANIELFVEDHAHEHFLMALLKRLSHEEGVSVRPHVASARGGHPRVLEELDTYQRAQLLGSGSADLLVCAVDANCMGWDTAGVIGPHLGPTFLRREPIRSRLQARRTHAPQQPSRVPCWPC